MNSCTLRPGLLTRPWAVEAKAEAEATEREAEAEAIESEAEAENYEQLSQKQQI